MLAPRASAWPALATAILLGGCAAPFSDLQGARLAGKGTVELTPSYSSVAASVDGEDGLLQREYTVQLAAGTSDRSDWRFRYTWIDLGDGGISVFGAGPKFAVVPERLATALPIGFAFGQGLEVTRTIQIHPTVLVTVPASRMMEINGSGKVMVAFNDIGSIGLAANLGAAIGPDLPRWALRPEVGIMTWSGGGGYARHASLGLSLNLGR